MTELTTALFRAVCRFALAYFVLVHILVAIKWQSGDFDGRYTEEKPINPELPEYLKKWQDALSDTSMSDAQPDLNQIDNLVESINALPTTRGSSVDQASELLKAYRVELKLWEKAAALPENVSSISLLQEGSKTIQNWRLNNLLQRTSLTNLTDEMMQSLVNRSIGDLQAIADQNEEIKWHTLNGILSPKNPFPEKEKISLEDLHEDICVLPPLQQEEDYDKEDDDEGDEISEDDAEEESEDDDDDDDLEEENNTTSYYLAEEGEDEGEEIEEVEVEDDNDLDLSLYLQEEDLAAQFESLQSLLDHRGSDLQLYFENSSSVIESISKAADIMEETFTHASNICASAVEETSASIADFEVEISSSSQEDDHDECDNVNEENILLLVEAGLGALARRRDIREALLRSLQKIDPEVAKDLILDADLNTDPPLPQARNLKQVSALILLDSPIICQLSYFMDSLLDHVGGHFDALDQYVDQLAERLVDSYNEDASSLGRVFLTSLLIHSGHLAIPIPTVLSDYMKQSRRGRELLASLI